MRSGSIHLHVSNRLEELAGVLADIYASEPPDPLVPETIVVPSRGVGRWISLQLANRLGAAMNLSLPYPQRFIDSILAPFGANETDAPDLFATDVLPWRILVLLTSGTLSGNSPLPLSRFVADPAAAYEASRTLGFLFDKYLHFRPALLKDWEAGGEPSDWQAGLWRQLCTKQKPAHELDASLRALGSLKSPEPPLPSRVFVFGITSLPPVHLQVLADLARAIPVHMFRLEPTPEFWADLTSRKRKLKALRSNRPDATLMETGHPLLASCGQSGMGAQSLLLDHPLDTKEYFAAPPGGTLLERLQRDIFELSDPGGESYSPEPLAQGDRSIRVHECSSPKRELEVLHDQLLRLFEENEDLHPSDVLVLAPDIENYAALIPSVFEERSHPRIPYTIADRQPRNERPMLGAFLALVELMFTRFPLGRVFDVLELEPIRDRFGIESGDLLLMREKFLEAGVRWGYDIAHREEAGLPPYPHCSWRYGMDRILLGIALADETEEMFEDIAPADGMEGAEARAAGRVMEIVRLLGELRTDLQNPRSLADWAETLRRMAAQFLPENGLLELQTVFARLEEIGAQTNISQPMPLRTVHLWIEDALLYSTPGGGFLAGGVTFCSLVPMRAVPAKCIWILGMNEGAFPRRDMWLAFDRMQMERQPGDRSAREDDRMLFLETILAARAFLHISYCGRSPHKPGALPPAFPVQELLECLRLMLGCSAEQAGKALVRHHPLHAFSPEAFEPGDYQSYSASDAEAANVLQSEDLRPRPPFLSSPLPDPPESEITDVPLSELERFFQLPSEFFARARLGIYVPGDMASEEEAELFRLADLARYKLHEKLVEAQLQGKSSPEPDALLRLAEASGLVPPLGPGRAAARQALLDTQERLNELPELRVEKKDVPVDLTVGSFRLIGSLQLAEKGPSVEFRPSNLKAKDKLRAWIRHVTAAACGWEEPVRVAGFDDTLEFAPVDDPARILSSLLTLYARGHSEPLPFFPETSHAFADALIKGKDREAAFQAAANAWAPIRGQKEADNRWTRIFFSEAPLNDDFAILAVDVFRPVLAHARKL